MLSDTHTSSLSSGVLEKLKGLNLDLIIHCGDYTDINVVHQLKELGNFCGVSGNMDPPAIREILKEKEIIEVEGKKIGIFHRYGLFFANRKLENIFKGEKIDIYFHGHTHRLRKEKKGDVYYLNPGPFPKSMLIVSLEKGKEIEVKIIRF
ncbi:MAG: metallophosphoesterase family protein [Nitrospirota bacterium]